MTDLGLETDVVDADAYHRTVERFRERSIQLPTFAQLADPNGSISDDVRSRLTGVDRNAPDPNNLWRVHWYNDHKGGTVPVPDYIELPTELTGVEARILLALGNRFPMIGAHKVLAAYSCLAPRIVTGQFDPTTHRAIWPSTGNYARGGVAISRIMGCRGVAVLPEGMSQERFDWLDKWIAGPEDVIRTTGTESNVKEIYDACAVLRQDPQNVILNQFSEFGNHLGHYAVTGPALGHIVEHAAPGANAAAAFISASGSAGTLGAGDYLKDSGGTQIVAVEALECPTMLYNGYGEHNIQGIGDKHIPYIHNVTNTDAVVAISDRATDQLGVLFNTEAGRRYLVDRRHVDADLVDMLGNMGFSSICNMLAAIKMAKHNNWGREDIIVTVATDGYELYLSEHEKILARDFAGGFGEVEAAEVFAEHLASVDTDHLRELGVEERNRIFNLGYYTWVEQQGVAVEDFDARRDQSFWDGLRPLTDTWDELITEFNGQTGTA